MKEDLQHWGPASNTKICKICNALQCTAIGICMSCDLDLCPLNACVQKEPRISHIVKLLSTPPTANLSSLASIAKQTIAKQLTCSSKQIWKYSQRWRGKVAFQDSKRVVAPSKP